MKNHKRKIRILLVIRWPVGGIRTFLKYVYNNFDPSLYDLTVTAPDISETGVLLEDLKSFDPAFIPFRNGLSYSGITRLILKTLLGKRFDLVHSQGFTSGICSSLPCRLAGVKHLMTSHDVISDRWFTGFTGHFKKNAFSFLLSMTDAIHSVSDDASRNLLRYIPERRKKKLKHVVIKNGIDINRFLKDQKRDLRKELSLPDDSFLIGFMGRFMSQKGFAYLIQAIELISKNNGQGVQQKKPFVIAVGSGGYIDEEKVEIRKRGLEDTVLFLPFESEILPVLRGLDVLAMPSLWEACGLLAIEAMVAGVPVIGTDCMGLNETLTDTPSIVVPAGDPEALANALIYEIKTPSRAKAEEFRRKASERFDVKKQSKELERVIQGLINGKS